eukprot:SAG31_NODE_7709_length_1610_cov_3.631614_3_plen_29_part_01
MHTMADEEGWGGGGDQCGFCERLWHHLRH